MRVLTASVIYAGVLLAKRGLNSKEARRLEATRVRVGPADEGAYDFVGAELFNSQFGDTFFSPHGDQVISFRETLMNYVISGGGGWTELLPSGRRVVARSLTPNERQCFDIAGLLVGSDPDTVRWWDICAEAVRSRRSGTSSNDGREAERLSLELEIARLAESDLQPVWMALEDNGFGCDIKSFRSGSDGWTNARTHFIEVKSTISRPRFFISRNEWNFARRHSESWELHFWDMRTREFWSMSFYDLAGHMPRNYGSGEWVSAMISPEEFDV